MTRASAATHAACCRCCCYALCRYNHNQVSNLYDEGFFSNSRCLLLLLLLLLLLCCAQVQPQSGAQPI
jgi:hypothetical protein